MQRWVYLVGTISAAVLFRGVLAQNIILTNDDGWAVAQIRAQFAALGDAGFDVVLSSLAENESGTGSSTATPEPLTEPCEYDTCPTGSPAEGFNASDTKLNYVNSYPVDAVRYGIQTLAPEFFSGAAPDLVVSGPNVGNNLGTGTQGSGTVGAAYEAAKEGIPSSAFSAATAAQVSYTTLTSSPNSPDTLSALLYTAITANFTQTLLAPAARPILPVNVTLNTCGSTTLPAETTVIDAGCYATVSVMNANTKDDVDADTQAQVYDRLAPSGLFTCFTA